MEFGNSFMLHIQESAKFGTIPTLRLETMRGLSFGIWNFATCLFNNYNVVIPPQIVFGNIFMLNIKEHAQFGTIETLRLEAMRGLSLETSP